MTTEPNDHSQSSTTPQSAHAHAARRVASMRSSPLTMVAFVLMISAVGVTAWQWYVAADVGSELQSEVEALNTQQEEAAASAQQTETALHATEAKLAALEAKWVESQAQQTTLQNLYVELTRNREDSALTDIEQSILLASQQLQIAANVRAALLGLENAQSRLQTLSHPRYANLRREVVRDIDRLRALPQFDVHGLSASIDDHLAVVNSLPLAMDARTRPEPVATVVVNDSWWSRLAQDFWQELRQLVRVQRTGEREIELLAPDQVFFLRENIKLRLLSARVALLSRDAKSYRQDLQAVQDMLGAHFEIAHRSVAETRVTLTRLQGVGVQVEVPDLAHTLEALRQLRHTPVVAAPSR